MIRHVLFDNDGTLVDSEILAVRAMLIQLRKHGLELSEQEYSSKYPGLRERDILSMIQEEYAVSIPPDFMQTLRNEHRESFQRNLRSIAGMPGLFRKVHKPKSVVSNGSLKHVNRSLKKIKTAQLLLTAASSRPSKSNGPNPIRTSISLYLKRSLLKKKM